MVGSLEERWRAHGMIGGYDAKLEAVVAKDRDSRVMVRVGSASAMEFDAKIRRKVEVNRLKRLIGELN